MTVFKRPGDVVALIPLGEPPPAHPYASDAARLAESGGANDFEVPAFLLTLFVPDEVAILASVLDTLRGAASKQEELIRLGIYDFNVESSMTASLSEVGAMGLVLRPVFEAGSAWRGANLGPERLERIARLIADEVTAGLGSEADALDAAGRAPGAARLTANVKPLGHTYEPGMYAGKDLREVRFGLRRDHLTAAGQCGAILGQFAAVLRGHDCPIAYVHYPHRWNSYGDDSLDWLRIAFAVDADGGRDAAIEIEAWRLACAQQAALVAYDPSLPHRFRSDRFARLYQPERADEPVPEMPRAPHDRVGLCAEGPARVGLVADLLAEAGDVLVEGCTVAILHGRTVANLIVVDPSASRLEEVLRERLEPVGGEVQRFDVSNTTKIIPRLGDEQLFTFWMAWVCPDRAGAINEVLRALYEQFRTAGLPTPNIVYGTSRVLADGRSCVAKFKFSCDVGDAGRFGLLDGTGALDTRSVSTSTGAAKLREAVMVGLGAPPDDWQPSDPAWRTQSVRASGSEPHDEPWVSLGLPAGALIGSAQGPGGLTQVGPGGR